MGDTVAVSLKATVPDKPGKPVATAGPGKVDLTWADPNDASITKYQYRHKEGSGAFGNWKNTSGTGANTVAHTVTGLTGGTAYTFQVRAVNAAGPGAASEESEPATPTGPPLAPTGFSATAGPVKAALAWTNPSDTTITKYQYRQSADGGSNWSPDWTDIPLSDASTTSYEVTGLTGGTAYTFQLRAVNDAGPGAETDVVTVTPVAAVPLAPPDFRVTEGDESAILSWGADDDNGAAITGYQYQQDSGAWTDIDDSAPGGDNALSFTVTGLTNDVEYTFKLRAVNSIGEGGASDAVTATPTAALAPGVVPAFSAGGFDESARLFWGAADDNGAAITGYQYQQDGGDWNDIPDSAPDGANALSFTVTGLTNGTVYTFNVRAVNSLSAGAETGDRTLTPAGVPLAPTGFSATRGDASVILSWTAAANNGSPLTKYQYQQDGSWKDIPDSAPGRANAVSFTVTGLTNGTTYRFRVRAVSGLGHGAETGQASATPGTAVGQARPATTSGTGPGARSPPHVSILPSGQASATPGTVNCQAAEIELWSTTLTVGKHSSEDEFGYNFQFGYGSLSPTSFTHGERRYTSPNFSYRTNGHFTYAYFPDIRFKSVLTLIVDGEEFSASDPNYNSFSGSMFWTNHGLT